jgi:hypothetical protein
MAGPPDLIYFIRAFQGLVQYLAALDTPVDLHGSYEAVRPAVTSHAVEAAAEKKLFPTEGKSRYL